MRGTNQEIKQKTYKYEQKNQSKKRNQQIESGKQVKCVKLFAPLQYCLQIIENKMYNNQRHIIMPITKDKAKYEEPKHLDKQFGYSYQTQQTTYDESEDSRSDDSEDQIAQVQELECKSSDKRPLMKGSFHPVDQEQIQKGRFLSATKLYEDQLLQKYQPQPHSITHRNYFLKCHQANLKQRNTKLSIIKQLLYPKNQTRFQQLKQKIFSSPIFCDKIQQMEITFFKCECLFATISQKSFKQHLKLKSHKAYLWIQTKKQRRNQQRFYKKTLFVDVEELSFFNPFWLYKSFEVIFVQGGVHWELDQMKRFIRLEMEQLKIQQLDPIEIIDARLKKNWKRNYIKLHTLHKGNQRILHKCMDIDEHLYLFALAIVQAVKKSEHKFVENEKKKYQVFLKLIKIILIGFLDRGFKTKENTKGKILKLLEHDSIREVLLKFLRNYIQAFDYIDLYEFSTTFD